MTRSLQAQYTTADFCISSVLLTINVFLSAGFQGSIKAMYDLVCLLCIAFIPLCCNAEHTLRSSALIQSCANCCPGMRASLLKSQLSWLCESACEPTFNLTLLALQPL